ncbi:hypothetical protein [Bacteriovorax sp. DB6_IX]|uniref:hypothetical protein n=1 Tax=Bacteriovorax sp. DB6_IX TaxID=1353530 RepID=UPI0012F7E73C|nr:hypothetical protein [Bacteriovorax sp. DB6_IX]
MLKLLFSLLLCAQISAAIWKSERPWQEADMLNFREWVKSELNRDIFSNPDSPYFGIKTDCADAIFAYMAIYSLENQLYYQVKLSHDTIIDSDSPRFDHLEQRERLKALIHFIGSNAGTYALAYYNSYPVGLKDIQAGDIYITEWIKNGQANRHAYLIKDFLPTGHFILYSSTTPVKVRTLAKREGMPLHLFSAAPWGYKRIAPYYLIKTAQDKSNQQYDLLKKWGKNFHNNLSKLLATEDDNYDLNLNRRLGNICDMMKTRIEEVNSSLVYQQRINRCMNATEYYMYSTPSRDSSLQSAMTRLLVGWKNIRKQDISIDPSTYSALEYFYGKDKSSDAKKELYAKCPVSVMDSPITMRDFFMLKRANRISSNPNDSLASRWGLSSSTSSCPRY